MEKSKEKTSESTFGKKLFLQENDSNQTSTVKKEPFPWTQKNAPNDQNDPVRYSKYLEELLERSSVENSKPDTSPPSQTGSNISIEKTDKSETIPEDNIVKSIQRAALDEIVKYQKIINSLSIKVSEYEEKIKSIQPEMTQYQNVINSLRLEIEKHENTKPYVTPDEVNQYQKLFKSLRDENIEYKRKIESMQPEIIRYQQIINSLKSDLEQYKNTRSPTTDEGMQHQQLVYSLKAELAEYRKFKTQNMDVQHENTMKMLNAEIARLKNNLDAMTLK